MQHRSGATTTPAATGADHPNHALIAGEAHGPVLHAQTGLSFWGGVDPLTGTVIDSHHPLFGQCISGTILAIPSGRGSCTGSCVMLELILNGVAPAALVLQQREDILPLGVIIAEEMFGRSLPVIRLGAGDFSALGEMDHARLGNNTLFACDANGNRLEGRVMHVPPLAPEPLALSPDDEALLSGKAGAASQLAMTIVTRMAGLYGTPSLIDITQAHIDGCIYIGPGGLAFAERLCAMGAAVAVPTTLNAISIDRRAWRAQGIASSLGEPAERLANAYTQMGAKPSYTCAPYLLASAPAFGEQIVWAESNAVVFANSVIGARTMKYPDYLDICVALTGRAPLTGCHTDAERRPGLVLDVEAPVHADDSFYPLLGYHAGLLAPNAIPLVTGLAHLKPTRDDLKAFGAAFATSSAAPMFHLAGITPEAHLFGNTLPSLPHHLITLDDLRASWVSLNSASTTTADLVALGNPHLSCEEISLLAALCREHMGQRAVETVLTCGRGEYEKALAAGSVGIIEQFGARFVTDTCWCMLTEPVVPHQARVIMTNSGKYAHYAPALVGRAMRFGSLADCIKAACAMPVAHQPPAWLAAG